MTLQSTLSRAQPRVVSVDAPAAVASAAPLPANFAAVLAEVIEQHEHQAGALLPMLHAVQNAFGWVPLQAVQPLAKALNLSRAEVYGVLSFYHYFRTEPVGQHVVQVCRAESCQAMGGAALEAHVRAQLGVDWHGTSADGRVTLLPVYCLGQCACSPAIQIDERVHGRVTPARFDRVWAALQEGQA